MLKEKYPILFTIQTVYSETPCKINSHRCIIAREIWFNKNQQKQTYPTRRQTKPCLRLESSARGALRVLTAHEEGEICGRASASASNRSSSTTKSRESRGVGPSPAPSYRKKRKKERISELHKCIACGAYDTGDRSLGNTRWINLIICDATLYPGVIYLNDALF